MINFVPKFADLLIAAFPIMVLLAIIAYILSQIHNGPVGWQREKP